MPEQATELSFRSLLLAVLFAILLAAANAYLGLKVGVTVSASIPSAILSMGVLRLGRRYSVLEVNMAQTGASAGEALIAGAMFVLPALLILGYWQQFAYWETVGIVLTGGTLGCFFSIPLRRVLLADPALRFPEGTAVGQVLQLTQGGSKGQLRGLAQGSALGGLISLCQSGFQIIGEQLALWFRTHSRILYGATFGFESAMLGAGYIMGIEASLSMLVGALIQWVGTTFLSAHQSLDMTADAATQAMHLWQTQLRPMGIGTMLVGSIWTLMGLFKPVLAGLRLSLASLKAARHPGHSPLSRQERDLPLHYAAAGIVLILLAAGVLLQSFLSDARLALPFGLQITSLTLALVLMLSLGFCFAALGGYFAGLLGSSNSPVSSVSLLSLLLVSLLLAALFSQLPHLEDHARRLLAAQGFAIILGTMTTTTAAITNNLIQDFKTGHMVGATPWRQQAVMMIGVFVSAFAIAPVLSLLYNAYGMGGVFPRPGMDPGRVLAAPQAVLMTTLVKGAFSYELPWHLIGVGCLIGILCIVLDHFLKQKGLRLLVLAVGSGVYLPTTATMAVVFGGVTAWIVERTLNRSAVSVRAREAARQRGVTAACGLVAGSSLVGVALAIPFTIAQSTNILKLRLPASLTPCTGWLGMLAAFGVLAWIYRIVCCPSKSP